MSSVLFRTVRQAPRCYEVVVNVAKPAKTHTLTGNDYFLTRSYVIVRILPHQKRKGFALPTSGITDGRQCISEKSSC